MTIKRRELKGLRVLVVEDDPLVAMVLQDYLEELEIITVGPVSDMDTALTTAKVEAFDLALLDVNLAGALVYPVAEALSLRKIPFAFMTGQDADRLPNSYGDLPSIQKPYGFGHIERYLRTTFGIPPEQINPDPHSAQTTRSTAAASSGLFFEATAAMADDQG